MTAAIRRCNYTEVGGTLAEDAFVFSPFVEATTPFRPDNVTNFFTRVWDAVGAPTVRLHDLRHFTATQLIGAGVDVRTVAEWLDFHPKRRQVCETIPDKPVQRLTLTVEEAASALGISRSFAYEAIAKGEIPCIRIGKRILVPKIALENMLNV